MYRRLATMHSVTDKQTERRVSCHAAVRSAKNAILVLVSNYGSFTIGCVVNSKRIGQRM